MKRKPRDKPAPPAAERLQKLLAAAGLGSRRALEKNIEAGEVLVNGETARLGATAGVDDVIEFGQRRWKVVSKPVRHRTLIYNKPEGEVLSLIHI